MRQSGTSDLRPDDALDIVLLAVIALLIVAVALYLADALSILVGWL